MNIWAATLLRSFVYFLAARSRRLRLRCLCLFILLARFLRTLSSRRTGTSVTPVTEKLPLRSQRLDGALTRTCCTAVGGRKSLRASSMWIGKMFADVSDTIPAMGPPSIGIESTWQLCWRRRGIMALCSHGICAVIAPAHVEVVKVFNVWCRLRAIVA